VDAVVFAAAPLEPTSRLLARLGALHTPYVVCADNGAATALAFGLIPDVVVGDLDSLTPSTLKELRQRNVAIETHPRDKDATDGQLALARALEAGPARLWLLGFLAGPRLDQSLANLLLLTGLETPATLLDERNEGALLRPGTVLTWRPEADEVVSLIPLRADASGVRTRGLRWPLDDATLKFADTRGVSNEPSAPEVSVSLSRGLLLVTRHFPNG
jgi:thiamine pyrophosphokinase